MATCGVCFRHCTIPEGQLGFCGGRTARDGRVEAYNYGRITSLALDPIEKKPFKRFFPGSLILSVGSFGCNLRCPFCQNHEISWSEQARALAKTAETVSPEELVDLALRTRSQGNIGIAFTYNEPLIGYEFVIDAMNIDLKGFTDRYYSKVLSGDRQQVMAFIEAAVKTCHVELTTLIVPGENDGEEEMRELSRWVSRFRNPDGDSIPLHISRFFPRFHMQDRKATDVRIVKYLARIASETLEHVYTGNC